MRLYEGKRRDLVLRAVADEYSRRILTSAVTTPKSVPELSRELDIPTSTCYRKVARLKDAGLLEIERTILTKEGKKWELFRSTIKKVSIHIDSSAWSVDVEVNEAASERLQRLWQSLRG